MQLFKEITQLFLLPCFDATCLAFKKVFALREERRIEEAPQAYKPIGPVIAAQETAGLIQAAVKLRPWVTFKA